MKPVILVNDQETPLPTDGAAAIAVEPGVFSILSKGKSIEVRIAPEGGGFTVEIQGSRYKTEVCDPRNTSRRSKSRQAVGLHVVKASMPGKVIRLLVSAGQEVAVGQSLIVVEAMKMQNEIKALKPGRVSQIHVKDGDTVAAGNSMITIE